MRVYKTSINDQSDVCVWTLLPDVLEEIESLLPDFVPGEFIKISVSEMTQEELDALGEFDGY